MTDDETKNDDALIENAKTLLSLLNVGHEKSWFSTQEWAFASAVIEALEKGNFSLINREEP